jgi:transcriptional regulator with XRE-family HTH domain
MDIDFSIATSVQIEQVLCEKLAQIRLARNLTQPQLAQLSGVNEKTIRRLEKGQGVSLDTFLRVMIALGLQGHLQTLLPDPSVRPVERVNERGHERRRARPVKPAADKGVFTWGDEKEKKS